MLETNQTLKGKNISLYVEKNVAIEYVSYEGLSPIIVGFGPAGMFAALYLARCGAKPIII